MAIPSREQAENILADIRMKKGHISDEDRAITPPSVLEALKSIQLEVADMTGLLAKNLFSSDARFAYELIQNAEDNQYPVGATEYLSFSIMPRTLIIESNEVGFTERDVRAICSSARSSKTQGQGYIGEKGIGFKSVFKVARKVTIHSGPFCFAFEHDTGLDASGLGLVTPLSVPYEALPRGVGTRMTLDLTSKAAKDPSHLVDILQVPDTILLFLTKLKMLRIVNSTVPDEPHSTTYQKSGTMGKKVYLCKETTSHEQHGFAGTYVYVFDKVVRELEESESRPGSSGKVAVAFPVDADDVPIVARQHISAYLPVNEVGFKFLIQGDFVTQASREGIVVCPRNEQLLEGVADVFCDAAQFFARHKKLAHAWLEWLPRIADITNDFWRSLVDKIVSRLRGSQLLYSWSEKTLYRPEQLRFLPLKSRDECGEPFFRDLPASEQYLSPQYDSYWEPLRVLGLTNISFSAQISRFAADLSTTESRYQAANTSDEWHAGVADLILRALKRATGDDGKSNPLPGLQNEIRALSIIPLQSGLWVSALDGPVYFSATQGSLIPGGLALRLVRPDWGNSPAQRRLLESLGVSTCPVKKVIDEILSYYSGSGQLLIEPMFSHIEFLFEQRSAAPPNLNSRMLVISAGCRMIPPGLTSTRHAYFGGPDDISGLKWLFTRRDGATDYLEPKGVYMLHEEYLRRYRDKSKSDKDLQIWMAKMFNIQSIPVLIHHARKGLSEEFQFLIKYHSHELVSVLKQHWSSYGPVIHQVKASLENASVPSENSNDEIPLSAGYLPLPRLKSIWSAAGGSDHVSLFIKMPVTLEESSIDAWQFLTKLGVGVNDDTHFYLELLRSLSKQLPRAPSKQQILDVYKRLMEVTTKDDEIQEVRTAFSVSSLILLPAVGEQSSPKWIGVDESIWTGPEWLRCKTRLGETFASVEHLFRVVLKTRDFTWRDCLLELEVTKEDNIEDVAHASEIYGWLMREFRHHASFDVLRQELEVRQLIFSPLDNQWAAPSMCLWADESLRVPRQHSICGYYGELEHFFTVMLGVRYPDLKEHVKALRELANPAKPDEHWQQRVKDSMALISALKPQADDLKHLLGANILPVVTSGGQMSRTNSRVEFVTIDREEYAASFPDVHTLALTLAEVNCCRRFLNAMGLQGRYISKLVVEQTMAVDSRLDTSLTQILQLRAYAFYRCAIAYDSLKARQMGLALFVRLQKAKVSTSNNITKTSKLMQNGQEHHAPQKPADLHIDESGEHLHFHLTEDEEIREVCMLSTLPSYLRKFLGIEELAAEQILIAILQCRSLAAVDQILGKHGIAEVAGVQRPDEPAVEMLHDRQLREMDRLASKTTSVEGSESVNSSPSLSPSPRDEADSSEDDEPIDSYKELLECLINDAASGTVPQKGEVITCSSLERRSGMIGLLGLFPSRSESRDRKVGAAGELFAFEWLAAQNLPHFDINNWQSTLRHEVSCCDQYSWLPSWTGRETADIVYDDSEGVLMRILIANRYVSPTYAAMRLKFYIEVKTTTSRNHEAFYMSSGQYERMETLRKPLETQRGQAYLIIRVSQITGQEVGLSIFFDPLTERDEGRLHFSMTGPWTVRPLHT